MTDPLWTSFVVLVLLATNGFFVAAEFALVKARGFRIEALADEGRSGAGLARRIQLEIEPYLAACQLGITMASLGLGWVGEPAVAAVLEPVFRRAELPEQMLHTVSFLIGFVIFSSLHIVIGEQVPKTFAIRKPEPVAAWCAYPLHGFYLLVYPLNWILSRTTALVLGVFKVEEATHAEVLTDQELRGLIETSREHGALEDDKATMLANLFAFDERTVARVMIPRGDVVMLDVQAPQADNIARLRSSVHSRFPLIDGDPARPTGVILAKEIYAALLDTDESPWKHLGRFRREGLYVPETLKLGVLFETMRARRAHMALVVDEYGDLVGVVTLEDLLEEIVGDIHDETDPEDKHPIVADADGWRVHGLASLTDVERATELTVPDDLDANSVSGLFMQRLGRMPETGDKIEEDGFRLEVESMKDHHVEVARLSRLPPKTGAEADDADDSNQDDAPPAVD